MGRITQRSLTDLIAYCVAYARLLKAERNLKREGEVLTGARNGGVYQNPWMAVSNRAAAQCAKFASRLGLDQIGNGQEKRDSFDEFLNDDSATG